MRSCCSPNSKTRMLVSKSSKLSSQCQFNTTEQKESRSVAEPSWQGRMQSGSRSPKTEMIAELARGLWHGSPCLVCHEAVIPEICILPGVAR